jgi:hypothetical protein
MTSIERSVTVDAAPRPAQRLIARIVGRRLGAATDQMLSGLAEHLATHGGTT